MSGKGDLYGHSPPPCTRVSVSQTLTIPRSFDNAPIESFWSVLKNELVSHQDYKTRFTAINEITQCIELYYNEELLAKHCFVAAQGKSRARSGTMFQTGLSIVLVLALLFFAALIVSKLKYLISVSSKI